MKVRGLAWSDQAGPKGKLWLGLTRLAQNKNERFGWVWGLIRLAQNENEGTELDLIRLDQNEKFGTV